MSKYNLVVILAVLVFTFEVSNGASFHNPNNNILREIISGQDMQHLIDELNKVLLDLSSRFSNLLLRLSNNLNDLKTQANLPGIVEKLKEDINRLSQDNEVSEICSSSIKYEIKLLEKYVQEATLSCQFTLDSEVNPLRQQLEALTLKLQSYLQQINRDVFKCFKQSEGSFELFAECMKNTIDNVQQQLGDVKEAAVKVLDALEDLIPVLSDKVKQCVDESKKEVEDKAEIILKDFKECTQIKTTLTIRKLCWPNVDLEICNEW